MNERSPVVPVLVFVGAVLALLRAYLHVGSAFVSGFLPYALRKDFLQEWTMGHAAITGVDPYEPTVALASRWMPDLAAVRDEVLPHPAPHPPGVIWLSMPLGALSYEHASLAWLAVELILLAWLIVRSTPGIRPLYRVLLWAAALAWTPVGGEIQLGQINLLVACLLLEAVVSGRGSMLGGALAVKLAGWPLVLFWAIRGHWRRIGVAAGVAVVSVVGLVPILGVGPLWRYATEILPSAARNYRGHERNIAPAAVVWRALAGTGGTPISGISSAPLLNLGPQVAGVVSLATTALWAGGALLAASRLRSQKNAGILLLAAGSVANPVAWSHGLVACVPALLTAVLSSSRAARLVAAIAFVVALPDAAAMQQIAMNAAFLGRFAPFLCAGPLVSVALSCVAVFLADREEA